jgi:hypothetical protein
MLIIDSLEKHKAKFWLFETKSGVQISKSEYEGRDTLKNLDKLLVENKLKKSEIKFIGIAEGEGSFTALRTAANIANTFALYDDVSVFGLSARSKYTKAFILNQIKSARVSKIRFYQPKYSAAPNITKPKNRS